MTTTNKVTTPAKINDLIETTLRAWTSDSVKASLDTMKRVDIFWAEGWRSAHCISPKSSGSAASVESWAFTKGAINRGMPIKAQALMDLSAKAAGDKTVNGQPRAYWIRQANAVIGDIKTQLKRREDIEADIASGKQGANARTVSPEQKVRELLNDAIKRIQKADAFECSIELDDLVKGLGKLAKSIG